MTYVFFFCVRARNANMHARAVNAAIQVSSSRASPAHPFCLVFLFFSVSLSLCLSFVFLVFCFVLSFGVLGMICAHESRTVVWYVRCPRAAKSSLFEAASGSSLRLGAASGSSFRLSRCVLLISSYFRAPHKLGVALCMLPNN